MYQPIVRSGMNGLADWRRTGLRPTACMNMMWSVFTKWLADMAADQWDDGCVGHVIPDLLQSPYGSAAWGDAAVICP